MVYLTRLFLSKIKKIAINEISTIEKSNIFSKISRIVGKHPGDEVLIRGWIKNIRKMKNEIFVDVNDGSCIENIQIIATKNENKHLGVGQSIEVSGYLQESPKKKLEVHAVSEINVIGDCQLDKGYPFTPKQYHNPEYVREFLHMRPRVDYIQSIFRIRHRLTKILNDYMDENDFIQTHSPIITTNDCEGAGEVFLVRPDNEELLKKMSKINVKTLDESYFDKKTFLSVSGQFHVEAITHGLGDTYTFSPAFRAENSKSKLHLSEFYMFEAELAFIDDLEKLNNFIENLLKTVTRKTLDLCMKDIKNCSNEELNFTWLDKKWITMTYDEALKILLKEQEMFKTQVIKNEGFSKEQELFLVNLCKSPIFIIDWPKSLKPFYMKQSSSDSTKVHAVDLLMPKVGELVGGSLRENNLNRLEECIPNGLDWYLDLRKFGSIPTGGFGLGFERYLQLITNVKNIRDVIPFPRYPHNCTM